MLTDNNRSSSTKEQIPEEGDTFLFAASVLNSLKRVETPILEEEMGEALVPIGNIKKARNHSESRRRKIVQESFERLQGTLKIIFSEAA